MTRLVLKPPGATDFEAAAALCFRAKAHWGYDAAFMESCRPVLQLDARLVEAGLAQLAWLDGELVGVVEISLEGMRAELELIFVEPAMHGRGVGRRLMDWARNEAIEHGAHELHILSDPQARAFYEHQGAHFLRMAASDVIPGRELPRLVIDLA